MDGWLAVAVPSGSRTFGMLVPKLLHQFMFLKQGAPDILPGIYFLFFVVRVIGSCSQHYSVISNTFVGKTSAARG